MPIRCPAPTFYDEVKHRLLDAPDWDYTAENRLLFKRDHSTRFYHWVQRWLHQEWQVARLRHGQERGHRSSGGCAARQARWTTRGLVELLRRLPGDRM